jgi:hypothetical protein
MITTIYRTGQMKVPVHRDDVLEHWAEFDARRPEGHVSRSEALFASPDIHGGHCWLYDGVLSFRGHYKNALFNQITVESDNVRVYHVGIYNAVGYHYGNPTSEQISNISDYWQNSMTLTEWKQKVEGDWYGGWEILLPESEVISHRKLTYAELCEMYEEEGLGDYKMGELKELQMALQKSEGILLPA